MMTEKQQSVWDYLSEAKTLISRGQFTEAITLYQKVIEKSPERADLHRWLGVVQGKAGDMVGEISSYRQAIFLDAQQPDWIYWQLADLLQKQGQLEEAISIYQQGAKLFPHQAEISQRLTSLRKRISTCQNRSNESRVKQTLTVYLNQAKQVVEHDKFEEAISIYHEAIKHYPDQADLHQMMGAVQEKVGDIEGQIASYCKAIELEEQPDWVYCKLGILLFKKEQDINKSHALLTQAIALNPENPETYYWLGRVATKLKKIEQSIDAYRKAIDLNSKMLDIYERLGDSLSFQAQYYTSAALDAYKKARTKQKNQSALYEKSLELNPNDTALYISLGKILEKEQKIEQAITCYQIVLQIEPDNVAISSLVQGLMQK